MAEEPENLVLHLLRELRGDINEMRGEVSATRRDIQQVKSTLDLQTQHFESLEERFDMLREGTLRSIGLSSTTYEQQKKMAEELKSPARRVEALEKAR